MRARRRALGALSLVVLLSIGRSHGQQTAPPTLDAARAAAAGLPRLHSLIVAQNGRTLLEYYAKGAAERRVSNVKSVSKSVISTLVGIAIERRLIPSVGQPIAAYFPELARDADPRKRRITIEDLLTMRSGLISTSFDNYGAWVGSRNWVDYVLQRPMVADPGEDMEYSTGNTHLLSAILTKATKQSTWAFAQQQLGTPLGFTVSRWPRDPQGIYFGGNDMLLSPRQMLTIGQLYLDRGRAGTRQLVPAAWVDASCTGLGRSRFNPDQTYGYGWWSRDFAGRQGCFAWGYGGQYIIVFRESNAIVVTTSSTEVGDERRDHRRQIFDIIERLVLPALHGSLRSRRTGEAVNGIVKLSFAGSRAGSPVEAVSPQVHVALEHVKDEGDVENRDVGHEGEPGSRQPARPHVSNQPQRDVDGAAAPADVRGADQQEDPEQDVRNKERNQPFSAPPAPGARRPHAAATRPIP